MTDDIKAAIDSMFNSLITTTKDPVQQVALVKSRADYQIAVARQEIAHQLDVQQTKEQKEQEKKVAQATKVAQSMSNIAKDINAAVQAFQNGDDLGGTASLMDTCAATLSLLSGFAGSTSMAGPLGSLLGSLFSIISLILRQFEKPQKSLVDKIEEKLRLIQAEDKQQLSLTAIDEFRSMASSYPKKDVEAVYIDVKMYLDSLAEGNARNNMLLAGHWLAQKKNAQEPEISEEWLLVLEYQIQTGSLEMQNFIHLLGLADPTGSEYGQLDSLLKTNVQQQQKLMKDIRDFLLAKNWILILGTGGYGIDTAARLRPEKGTVENWKSPVWSYQDWSDISAGRTLSAAIANDYSCRIIVRMQGMYESGYQDFHEHSRIFAMVISGKKPNGVWTEIDSLKGCRDAWAYPAFDGNGFFFNVLTDTKTMRQFRLRGNGDAVKLDELHKWSVQAGPKDNYLKVRAIPSKQGDTEMPVVYILLARDGKYLIQVGNHPGQYIYLPDCYNDAEGAPRGIAVDEKRIWIYRGVKANNEMEIACMDHGDALALQAAPDQEECKAHWKKYGSVGVALLERTPGDSEDFKSGVGITSLSGAPGNILTMCFNGRIYTGEVDDADSGRNLSITWKPYESKRTTALMALEYPVKQWPLYLKSVASIDKILA